VIRYVGNTSENVFATEEPNMAVFREEPRIERLARNWTQLRVGYSVKLKYVDCNVSRSKNDLVYSIKDEFSIHFL
jgi:hypothetical protein